MVYVVHSTPLLCVQWKTRDDGNRNCPKYVEFHSKNKFEKLVNLVGFIIRISDDARSAERQMCTMFVITLIANSYYFPKKYKAICPCMYTLSFRNRTHRIFKYHLYKFYSIKRSLSLTSSGSFWRTLYTHFIHLFPFCAQHCYDTEKKKYEIGMTWSMHVRIEIRIQYYLKTWSKYIICREWMSKCTCWLNISSNYTEICDKLNGLIRCKTVLSEFHKKITGF